MQGENKTSLRIKKLTTFLLLLPFITCIYGQEPLIQGLARDDYLQKSKSQNTTGWALLLSGTAVAIIAGTSFSNSYDSASYTSSDITAIFTLAGVVADIVSIPFFISAGANKRKAASLSLNIYNCSPDREYFLLSKRAASVTLRVAF